MKRPTPIGTDAPIAQVLSGLCGDPRGVLGLVEWELAAAPADATKGSRDETCRLRVFLPPALAVMARGSRAADERDETPRGPDEGWVALTRVHVEGVFEATLPAEVADGYRLKVEWESGDVAEVDDPYRFLPELTADDLAAYGRGEETRIQDLLGAHARTRDGVAGVRFAVWAPRALAVNLMGSFNGWEARRHPMYPIPGTGVWELFLPGVGPGDMYKFQVRSENEDSTTGLVAIDKADPVGRRVEVRPRSASIIVGEAPFPWSDEEWVAGRPERSRPGRPISIYEVHAGSWRRNEDGSWLGYRDLAAELLPYVKDLGFTHLELLPMTEHPHDASWGYQTSGYFAATSRYGEPDDFKHFIDEAHRLGLGVILDWVPAHFPLDLHALMQFDGQPLYEHEDPMRGEHPDWGTAIFDYGRPEVISFLVSNARYWVDEFHVDGLRVDAVASMLYLDYSRGEGEWEPNELGGNENLEAVAFLKTLNTAIHEQCPGTLTFAEESTTWPGITAPVEEDGLGFDFKWNMGWMNDTLEVVWTDPHQRSTRHDTLTFSMHYAHNERHLLPLSHDEVVHLKRSLLSKQPGGYDDKLAGLRLLLGYMWTHPGAKLLFMGGELGVWSEWSEEGELDWDLLGFESHAGIQRWVRRLNALYVSEPELHALDHAPEGFEWIDWQDAHHSVLPYLRRGGEGATLVVAANFSAERRRAYRLGVPAPGAYEIVLDSDDPEFGGRGRTRILGPASRIARLEQPATLLIDLPPLSVVVLRAG